jgi:glycosyltransferase involved in cell wall biosynthesis
MLFSEEEIGAESRALARQRLGISPTAFLVATFGFAGKEKGMDICIAATEMLRGWNVPAELHFVGDTLGLAGEIRRVAQRCGVDAHVHMMQGFVEAALYRDYMLAADAAVQLRAYGLGQPSAALVDCISAGLPSVSTDELAASCDAPAYIVTVPTRCSPLHVAEGLATVWEGRQDRSSVREQRQAYLASHNFDYYARRLIEILELT